MNYRPRYDTLSYTWGNPKPTKPIKVNGEIVHVGENLFVALSSVCHKRKIVKIWADALCIDQGNNHEKSFQVAMMDRIYSQCRQTWISLGSPDEPWANGNWPPGPKLEERMRLVKYLIRGTWRLLWHHLVLRRSRLSRPRVNHVADTVRLAKLSVSKEQISDEDMKDVKLACSMLSWLTTHPYWTRVWVTQEVCLSRLDPICMFGKWRIPLLHLDTVLANWRYSFDKMGGIFDAVGASSHELADAIDRTLEICMLRDEFRRTRLIFEPRWLGLTRCLQLASHRRASLAHDHVYGLRSLLSPETRKSVHLDYNISVRTLYAAVTRSVLQQKKSMDVLCAAVGTRATLHGDLPSWVLDFSTPLLLPADREEDIKFKLPDPESGGIETLSLNGRSLNDKVIAVQDKLSSQWSNTSKLEAGSDVLEAAEHAENQLYQCMEVALMAGLKPDPGDFLRIMTTPIYVHDSDGSFKHQQEDEFKQKLNQLLRDATAAGNHCLNKELSRHAFPILSSFAKHWIGLPGRNDSFFCTEKGRIGKASSDIQIGDELWKLSTCKTPFILRRSVVGAGIDVPSLKRGQYRLVGPCLCTTTSPAQDLVDQEEVKVQRIDLI